MGEWEEEFDKLWYSVDEKTGVIFGKDGCITCDDNLNQIGAIKNYIRSLLSTQAQEIREEMIEEIRETDGPTIQEI
jgi:hypothetical protein